MDIKRKVIWGPFDPSSKKILSTRYLSQDLSRCFYISRKPGTNLVNKSRPKISLCVWRPGLLSEQTGKLFTDGKCFTSRTDGWSFTKQPQKINGLKSVTCLPVPVAAQSKGVGLPPLACWDRGFETHRGHGCLSVVSVVCCQVEVSAMSWSLV